MSYFSWANLLNGLNANPNAAAGSVANGANANGTNANQAPQLHLPNNTLPQSPINSPQPVLHVYPPAAPSWGNYLNGANENANGNANLVGIEAPINGNANAVPANANANAVPANANANANAVPQPIDNFSITTAEDMQFIIIPKGTLLYNAITIPEPIVIENPNFERRAYDRVMKEFMGVFPMKYDIRVEDNQMFVEFCIDKSAQKFFYSNPAGCPALGHVTLGSFNHINILQTTRDMKLVILMSPSAHHRRTGPDHNDKMQCDELPNDVCDCTRNFNARCPYLHHYDVCLTPEFLNRNGADGHIAIAREDSYGQRLKPFDEIINNFHFNDDTDAPNGDPLTNGFIWSRNRTLFDVGRSVDIREPSADFPDLDVITGFPELVLHLYGTNWFNQTNNYRITYPIVLPPGHDLRVRLIILKQFLIWHNENNQAFMNMHGNIASPFKLIGHVNPYRWLNFESFTRLPLPIRIQNNRALTDIYDEYDMLELHYMYLNLLNAMAHGDHNFYFDTRTGFLINDNNNQDEIHNQTLLITRDHMGVTFKDSCLFYGRPGQNDFIKSVQSRKSARNQFWRHGYDRLIDLYDPIPPYEINPVNIDFVIFGGSKYRRKNTRRNIRKNMRKNNRKNNRSTRRNKKLNRISYINKQTNLNSGKMEQTTNKGTKIQTNSSKTKVIIYPPFIPKPISNEQLRAVDDALAMPYEKPRSPNSVTKKALAITDALLMD